VVIPYAASEQARCHSVEPIMLHREKAIMEAPPPPIAVAPHRAFIDPAALAAETAFWVRFLDVMHSFPAVRANYQRAVKLLGLRPGAALLDVGCGSGSFARDMAAIVGETGRCNSHSDSG
jgi:cyclopropane fatty-acyl-phospholipid synthase-like methyltransferase